MSSGRGGQHRQTNLFGNISQRSGLGEHKVLAYDGDVYAKLNRELFALYKLRITGEVLAVAEHRKSVIEFPKMTVNETEFKENTPEMREVIDQYYTKVGEEAESYISICGFAPWRIEKRKISNNQIVEVPVLYPFGSFKIGADEKKSKGEFKDYIVYEEDTERRIKHVYRSKVWSGPNLYDGTFNTECGAVIDAYRFYEACRTLHYNVCMREANPYVFLQKVTSVNEARGAQIEIEYQKHIAEAMEQAIEGDEDLDGLNVISENNVVVIPEMHKLCDNVPRPVSHVDLKFESERLMSLIANTWKVPVHLVTNTQRRINGGGDVKRPMTASLQDRELLLNGGKRVAADISACLQHMYHTIYMESDVPVHIPLRLSVDMPLVRELYDFGAISWDEASQMLRTSLGLSTQVGSDPTVPDQVKQPKTKKRKVEKEEAPEPKKQKKEEEDEIKKK